MRRHDSALRATLTGVLDRMGSAPPLALDARDRLDGRRCLVTGATRGLGLAVATELARRGAGLVLLGRSDLERARQTVMAAARTEVIAERVDLADLQAIERFADRLAERGARLDVAVMNAGVVTRSARRTAQGFETMTAVNYFAHFVLLRRLLGDGVVPNQTYAGTVVDGARPRIVFVSSEAHRSAPPVEPAALGRFAPFGTRQSVAQYGRSKLLLTTFAMELSRRLASGGEVDVAVHALCPGAVDTAIAREAPAWSKPLLSVVMRALFRSPEQAAVPCVYLAAGRSLEGQTGVYLHHRTAKEPAPHASDPEQGEALWAATEALLERPWL